MRKALGIFITGFLCLSGNTLSAQFVVSDPAALAQLVLQYQRQLQQVMNELQQINLMILEGKNLATHPSTNIIQDLNMLSTILIQSQGLAGSMAQMDAQFRATYVPYAPTSGLTFATAYNQWATTTLHTVNGALNAAGYQGGMLQNEKSWTQQIQLLNQTQMGRDESIQLGNSIATQEVAQLQSLRELMLADMQSKAAYSGYQLTKDQTAANNSALALQHQDRAADPTSY